MSKYLITVRQLHREFLRAGAEVMQALTFYATESKMASEAAREGCCPNKMPSVMNLEFDMAILIAFYVPYLHHYDMHFCQHTLNVLAFYG